ncbi:hypothetical protein [Actinocrinis sp.]|uniref:hypothetical protein n=1 Tax=Actinocrinis sp. TaxID=1920516 RepID=UPI002D547DA7|nr:hypothetical protein [Actinocrinis sp.]HZP51009.1 hypothetical protein [Actinocrinis sp.]
MSEIGRNSRGRTAAAVDEYLRALGRAARDQAVAEAEQEVCRVWSEELARVQHVTELGVASAHAATQAAQILVREEQRIGDLEGLARAQQQLERAKDQERRSGEAARVLLDVVAEEQELLAVAAEERETVALANRIWLSSAGRAVCAAEADEGVDSGMRLDASDFDDH